MIVNHRRCSRGSSLDGLFHASPALAHQAPVKLLRLGAAALLPTGRFADLQMNWHDDTALGKRAGFHSLNEQFARVTTHFVGG